MQTQWLKFEIPVNHQPRRKAIRGIDAVILPSPHDVPERLRMSDDAQGRYVLIDFKYIDKEPCERVSADHLGFWLGRNSHRVYRIEFPSQIADWGSPTFKDQVVQKIADALKALEQQPSTASAAPNYDILLSGLSENEPIWRLARSVR